MKTIPDEIAETEPNALAKDFYTYMIGEEQDGPFRQFLEALFGSEETIDLSDSDIKIMAGLFQEDSNAEKQDPQDSGGK